MDGSIRLSGSERKTALSIYRGGGDARVARRAHVLLLLDRNWSYRQIMEALLCAGDFVAAVKQRFLEAGFDAALFDLLTATTRDVSGNAWALISVCSSWPTANCTVGRSS